MLLHGLSPALLSILLLLLLVISVMLRHPVPYCAPASFPSFSRSSARRFFILFYYVTLMSCLTHVLTCFYPLNLCLYSMPLIFSPICYYDLFRHLQSALLFFFFPLNSRFAQKKKKKKERERERERQNFKSVSAPGPGHAFLRKWWHSIILASFPPARHAVKVINPPDGPLGNVSNP